ncbi:MAG: AI-2E family transporter [Prevotellaceae bacterium]|nr:AI-2E family transporter [Prevotellaceae bacterium]
MNQLARYIVIIFIVAFIAFLAWYFSNIVAYILISAVLSLIGKPLVDVFGRMRVGKWKLPRWLCALATLFIIGVAIFLFFYLFIPLIASQTRILGNVDVNELVDTLSRPFRNLEQTIVHNIPGAENFSLNTFIADEVLSVFNEGMLTNAFGSIANFLGSMAIAIFSIIFITFFFLKEEGLFVGAIIILFPPKYEKNIRRALDSATRLLVRYFIGVVIDMLCVMVILTLGYTLFAGLDIRTALLIGLIAGILNVIPYIGPVIGAVLGIIISVATHVDLLASGEISSLVFRMILVFAVMKITDDFVLQPTIFANSVNAHPLEIFIVILLAGSLAGIGGMLLAIPAYTVIRVFAKEFFNHFRVVQKLTERMQ